MAISQKAADGLLWLWNALGLENPSKPTFSAWILFGPVASYNVLAVLMNLSQVVSCPRCLDKLMHSSAPLDVYTHALFTLVRKKAQEWKGVVELHYSLPVFVSEACDMSCKNEP